MFCPNCRNKLNGNEEFCFNCGNKILKEQKIYNNEVNLYKNENSTTADIMYKKSQNFIKITTQKIKKFLIKYKKYCLICGFLLTLLIIGIILFNIFYDSTKLSWDNSGDGLVTHIQSTTLNLNVLAYDKNDNPITEIKFSSNSGELESNGTTVKWKLPEEEGSYTITAQAPSGKKIEKTVKVINLKDNVEELNTLSGILEIPIDDETSDNDNDGITNSEENKLGTDPNSLDTDMDGLSDYYEINISKTDPLKKDTDMDGLNDGDELDLGLDPLKEDSKSDGVKDGQRSLTYNVENTKFGVFIEINGKGNIASSTIDMFENSTFSNMDGLLDKVYNFYTDGTIESAIVKINYNLEDIQSEGINEDNLTLYYFNEETKQLEALPTTVDKENKQIIVTLKHFSKYVIGDNSISVSSKSKIMFVIDNSLSMYSKEQIIAAGYEEYSTDIGNDTNFQRLTLTNKMIDMLTGNYEFGVAEFKLDYINLQKFSNDHDLVKTAVNSMKNNWHSNNHGTNIIDALKNGINEFSNDQDNHYLILLTDGKNNKGFFSLSKDSIITSAKNNNVKICVIGLGNNIDADNLNEISESTGCDYYNASDSSALDEIYSLIGANINYNYVDTNNDSIVDGMIQKDSGFLINRDGFSFKNFVSNKSENGNCYGMATFAMLYYKKQLPLTLEAKDNSKFYLSYFKTIDFASSGYDLKNTYFANNNSLYNFKINNEGLSIYLGDLPKDYRDRVENDTWMIKKEYYDKLENIGATFSTKKYKGKEDFSKYQSALLNVDSDKLNKEVSKDETQLLNAIWRLFILQANDKKISFSVDPDKAWNELLSKLSEGTPQVIGINGNHAINAIRLIQDTSDANKFKIEVYDNNYPGKTKYITVNRSKYNKVQLNYTAWTNEYNYKFTYDSDDDGKEEKTTINIINTTIE